MTEYMTTAEIEAKYPNEWIFIANPTFARGYDVRGGHVVFHCAERAEFLRRIGEWNDPAVKQTASLYTGDVSGGLGEVLPPEAEPGAA
jgi:hypothetical protein